MDEPILLTLDRHAYGGDAVGRLPDQRAVFVPLALPGERVRIRLVEEKKNYARGELVEIIQPAAERVPACCAHFGDCGGCHYQHLPYENQLLVKTNLLVDQLTRLGRMPAPPVQTMRASPAAWNYRNHIQFHLQANGKLGFTAPNSRRIVTIHECHLPEPTLNTLWPLLNFEAETGVERVSLRLGAGDDLLLLLESRSPEPPGLELEAGVSVVHQYEGESLVLAGEEHVSMEISPKASLESRSYRVCASSFFQVNTRMAEALVEHVLSILPENIETMLDVYSGVGLFSAYLAARVKRLICIETSPSACEDLEVNLDEFDNVELYEAPAEMVLSALKVKADAILVDPPRAGLEGAAMQAILTMQPETLIYISCDPATLARDARQLLNGGYQLQQVTPFDMFPHTYHIESVSLFTLRQM